MIALLTDLAACLDADDKLQPNIFIVQQKTYLIDDTHVEKSMTTTEFYEKIKKEGPGSTAAPSIDDYLEIFSEIENSGYDKLVITVMSEKISSTYSNAVIASKQYEGNLDFLVYNTNGVVTAEQAYYADFINHQYQSLEEIKENFDRIKTKLIFCLDNIDALKKGGRISPAQAMAASLLGIKPVIHLNEGKLELYDKVRTFSKGIEKMIDYVTENIDENKVFLTSVINQGSDVGEKLFESFVDRIKDEDGIKLINEIEPTIGTHTGAPLIGVSVSWKE
jgi:DegV family protein with EDD domain